MSTLDDRLSALEMIAPENRPCPMGVLLESLPDITREKLSRVLGMKISNRRIHSELQAEGYRIARESIALHRDGFCRCPKERK